MHQQVIRGLICLSLLIGSCGERKILQSQLKVVSLVPSVTEIIFALNKGSHLAGNTIYCDYPLEAEKVYKVGDLINPSIERIVLLKPDIVFLTLPLQKNILDKLSALKIKTFISQPRNLHEMFEEIRKIGEILNAKETAERLVDSLQAALDRLKKAKTAWRVYFELSLNPTISIGKNSFLNDLLSRLGVINIFEDKNIDYPVIKNEEIIERNPDFIFILHPVSKAHDFKKRLAFERVNAVKNNCIIDSLNPDLLLRPSPRILIGAKILSEIFSEYEENALAK